MFSKLKNKKGFTLVEVIIVIVVIGILMGALVPKVIGSASRSRDAARGKSIKVVAGALSNYYRINKSYPTASGCINASTSPGSNLTNAGFLSIVDFPKDPKDKNYIDLNDNGSSDGASECEGEFYYKSLSEGGIDDNAYVLVSKVELTVNGNMEINCVTANDTFEDIEDCLSDSGSYMVELHSR